MLSMSRASWEEELSHLLTWVQDGVVSRRQLLHLGAADHDVKRMLRRRELAVVHPGVYVAHTGRPEWRQRAWAAVLLHEPAALTRRSALPRPPSDAPIQVAVDPGRSPRTVAGVHAIRTARWQQRVLRGSHPPRLAPAEAAVEVAAAGRDPMATYALLADLCQDRTTTARELADALRVRRGVRDRGLLVEMLEDLSEGACSVLEREYLTRVERAHGLPVAVRQGVERLGGAVAVRDVEYRPWGLVVELDGRAFHDNARQRDRDLGRDLQVAAADGRRTVRLGWGQVWRDGCHTAAAVARLLQRRGWQGDPHRCPRCALRVDP